MHQEEDPEISTPQKRVAEAEEAVMDDSKTAIVLHNEVTGDDGDQHDLLKGIQGQKGDSMTSDEITESLEIVANDDKPLQDDVPKTFTLQSDPGPTQDQEISTHQLSGSLEETKSSEVFHTIPLRRYDLEASASDSCDNELRLTNEPGSLSDHLSTPMERPGSRLNETEDAGLDFVDIRLDQAEIDTTSPYGIVGPQASRSGIEIRQDSISSDSPAAKKVALEAEERERAQNYQLHRRMRTDSEDGSSTSSHSSRRSGRSGRSVEGRYMGRRSRQTSRAASPVNEHEEERAEAAGTPSNGPPASPFSLSIPFEGYSQSLKMPMENGVTMAVADAEGEITIVQSTDQAQALESVGEGTKMKVERTGRSEAADIAEPSQEQDQRQADEKPPVSLEMGEVMQDGVVPVSDAAKEAEQITTSTESAPRDNSTGEDASNDLKDVADKAQTKSELKKRRESTQKPTALEQHMSRTRMMTLPPKPKQEDVKHLNDYEEMMKMSREKEAKKQQEIEEKKRQKDVEWQEDMKIWEKDILPSWTRARREAKLRKLWSKGIPSSIRGRLWAMACGNNQMLPRNLFSKASAEGKKRLKDSSFPVGDLKALEEDIEATLPSLKLFQKEVGPLYDDLFDVLTAFVVVRIDQEEQKSSLDKGKEKARRMDDGSIHVYQRGTASVAAMLLTNLTPSETLIAMCNLVVERPWLRALYSSPHPLGSKQQESAAGFERVFDTLLADQMPKVYANMQARGVRPSSFVTSWVRTLFVPYLPFDLVARLWDCILLDEGDAFIYRIAIAIFSLLSARLYVPDKAELLSILKGNNRAALSVWYRARASTVNGPTSPLPTSPGVNPYEENRKRLSTSSVSIEASDDLVPVDDIYGGQYNINESNLFEVLDEQSSWWKDSMLERLLDRELVT